MASLGLLQLLCHPVQGIFPMTERRIAGMDLAVASINPLIH